MKKIFKIIIENSNTFLIFITIITLILIISISLESNRKANVNLLDAISLYTEIVKPENEADEASVHLFIDHFSGTYTGPEGEALNTLREELKSGLNETGYSAAWVIQNNEKLLLLISNYQKLIEERLKVFDTLFYFLAAGIAIQFIFMLTSLRKYKITDEQLQNSNYVLKLLNNAREKERVKISSFLHDSVLQDIGGLLLSPDIKNNQTAAAHLRQISDNLRELTYQIAPLQMNTTGFKDALLELAHNFERLNNISVKCSVTSFSEQMLNKDSRLVFYRIAQEALANIKKHAEAENVTIKLVASHPYLILRIIDDGKGFNNLKKSNHSDNKKHLGMLLMNEQAKSIGASLIGESTPGKGTIITLKYRIIKGKQDG